MKEKYLFFVYVALLASVFFWRNIKQNEPSYFFKSEPTNFIAKDLNKTNKANRILTTTSTNEYRISFCEGENLESSVSSSAMSEYRNIFGS